MDSDEPLPVAASIAPRGRGTGLRTPNRFERIVVEEDFEQADPNEQSVRGPRTEYLRDTAKSVVTRNDSPDIPFSASLNPYRGCEHGCAYCYARPYHEYLGMSAGLDFETKILVKEDAPALLRKELMSKRWQPTPLVLSGVTDPYQPAEARLKITRGCLEVLAEFRNPVGLITKNALVARDADLLAELARHSAASVSFSITTLDADLARRLEPRTATPAKRLEAMAKLAAAGVPVGVMAAPMIPGLNDHELPAILKAAAEAGASHAGYTVLRLPHAVEQIFIDWLRREEPGRHDKVLARLRAMRGGKVYEPRFGVRMRGEGAFAEEIAYLFRVSKERAGLNSRGRTELSTAAFRRPDRRPALFDAG